MTEFVPFVVLAVVISAFALVIRHMTKLKNRLGQRPDELEIAVASSGYFPSPAAERVTAELGRIPRLEGQRFQVTALLAREDPAGMRYVVDYFAPGGSARSSTHRGTLFGVRLTDRELPRFVFKHSSIRMPKLLVAGLDKLITLRYPGFERVPLEGVSPELAHCLFYAEDRDTGVRLLDAGVIEVLSNHDGWGLESTGSWLVAEKENLGRSTVPEISTVCEQLGEFERLADAFGL